MEKIVLYLLLLISFFACSQKKDNLFPADTKTSDNDTIINGLFIQKFKSDDEYSIYMDRNRRYGICDKNGNIIIIATYDDFGKRGNNYYMAFYKNNKTMLYWLNAKNKKLEALPNFFDFHMNVNDSTDVFFKDEIQQKLGVVINRKKIILPFQYDYFNKIGDKFIATKNSMSKTDGKVDVFDKKLKRIPIQENLINYSILSDSLRLIAIRDNQFKVGIIDYNLKILVPCEYYSINSCLVDENYFIVTKRKNHSTLLYGIMNNKGKIIVPLIYTYIKEKDEKKILIEKNGKFQTIDFNEFINLANH